MTLSIRLAQVDDVPEIADLAARTFPLACPPELAPDVVRDFVAEHLTPDAFRGYLAADGHEVLCARDAGGTAVAYALLVDGTAMDPGCASQIEHRPTVGVSKFYVDPAHHGTGAATVLLDDVVRRAVTRGARSLWLATNVANERARRFYTRHGFVERGGRTFVVGGVPNTDVVYERPLVPADGQCS
ncbi:N-acetyltransferase family protein [Dietzia sp. 179-F 9C3 NHS]|uniref:N-acetyltransferase family protein n=1 Tax=Dietzia sp. 179-F 9C3 NHS TaxID=3374295 RepID=UPI00387A0D63